MSSPDQPKDQQHTTVVEAESGDSPAASPPRRKWIRYAVIGGVLVAAAVIAVIVVFTTQSSDNDNTDRTAFTLDQVLSSPEFVPRRPNGTWHDAQTILQRNTAGDLVLYNVTDGTARLLLPSTHAAFNSSHTQQLSADGRFLLLSHIRESVFRHSYRSTYQVLEIADGVVVETPAPRYISADGSATPLDYALFGPTGSQLVFVQQHDLFYVAAVDATLAVVRITDSGSATVFNGVCDWVYEEEIFSRSQAVWFGPAGNRLVFAQFDDTAVHNVTMWHWGETTDGGPLSAQYPDATHISYPKVGTINPHVRLYDVQLIGATAVRLVELPASADLVAASAGERPVLTAVDLTADDERVVAVWMNRAQNSAYVEVCEKNEAAVAKCSTTLRFTSTTGWLHLSEPLFLNAAQNRIAIVQPVEQSMQIVTHSLVNGQPDSRQLLIAGVHVERLLHWDSADDVYFAVGNNASITEERQLYAVYGKAPANNSVHCLTCALRAEYSHFDARFGADGGHYLVLESQGPAVPRHDLYEWSAATPGSLTLRRALQTNDRLAEVLRAVAQPTVEHSVVQLSANAGEASVRLMLPPGYGSTNRTYPMLVYVYAGPGTFAGSSAWQLSWNAFMASNRSVVVAQIDGRGTARRDLRHLHSVYRKLGQLEVADQIDVTRQLTKSLKFVDAARVGVWGHSYGGYATGMIMATDNAERVFRCGASVAPVTDWMYYDSLYTERYMGLAADNADGYRAGSLLEHALGLRDKQYYLVHGTGDDNVHFQMSMELARELEVADVEFEQMSYPNEAHSLGGVRSYHFSHMTKFFDRCFHG